MNKPQNVFEAIRENGLKYILWFVHYSDPQTCCEIWPGLPFRQATRVAGRWISGSTLRSPVPQITPVNSVGPLQLASSIQYRMTTRLNTSAKGNRSLDDGELYVFRPLKTLSRLGTNRGCWQPGTPHECPTGSVLLWVWQTESQAFSPQQGGNC